VGHCLPPSAVALPNKVVRPGVLSGKEARWIAQRVGFWNGSAEVRRDCFSVNTIWDSARPRTPSWS
jgi:hypothetical protein